MKRIFLITSIVLITNMLFSQSEDFSILKYSINNKEQIKFQPETNANGYVSFLIYRDKDMFMMGNGRDSTFSYGYIEKLEEFDGEVKDSANLVVCNRYKWYYANSYNYQTGVAIIETQRIFYSNTMLFVLNIYVTDKDIKENNYRINVIAYNPDY